jgi:hypothetical protein
MLLLAGIAMVGLTGPAASLGSNGASEAKPVREARTQYAIDQCFTDDGYGRKRSCSQGYKAKRKAKRKK